MCPPCQPAQLSAQPSPAPEIVPDRSASDCYSLRMEGHAMCPVLPEGTVLIVSPDSDAAPGNFVVVEMPDGHLIVRQLISCNCSFHLKTLNPYIPPVPLGDGRIVGVICEAVRRLR